MTTGKILLFEIAVIMAFTILSCKKEEQYMNNAEISADNRTSPCLTSDPCDCPGGFFVFIDNVSDINGRTYKTFKLPSNFIIPANLSTNQSSVSVKINWQFDTITCNNYINITRIERR